jgi:DNA-binding transcriptional regulator YhcF (GntR family)
MPWSRHHATLLRKLSIVLAERCSVGERLPDVTKLAAILGCNPTPLKHVLTEAWAIGIVDKAARGFVYRGGSQPTRRQRSPHA